MILTRKGNRSDNYSKSEMKIRVKSKKIRNVPETDAKKMTRIDYNCILTLQFTESTRLVRRHRMANTAAVYSRGSFPPNKNRITAVSPILRPFYQANFNLFKIYLRLREPRAECRRKGESKPSRGAVTSSRSIYVYVHITCDSYFAARPPISPFSSFYIIA